MKNYVSPELVELELAVNERIANELCYVGSILDPDDLPIGVTPEPDVDPDALTAS